MAARGNDAESLGVYSPTPNLGYGYNAESLARALELGVDCFALDGGSTDPGPNYLGGGESFTNPLLVRRDLTPILRAAAERGTPVIIGTAGGSGGEPHLESTRRIVTRIATELGVRFRTATIHAEQSKEDLLALLSKRRISPLWPLPELTAEAIQGTTRVVALMGAEPYIEALDNGAQVIIAGRSDDAAVTAGFAIRAGIPAANAWLAGKFLECGGACALPRHGFGYDGLLATLGPDSVVLEALHPGLRVTAQSAAAFLLHENESPVHHPEPGGCLDLTGLAIEELDERRVRLTGAVFQPEPLTVRLEGVELVGYRTLTVAWTRDPVLIPQIDAYLERARERVARMVDGIVAPTESQLLFRLVGKDAVMGSREPVHAFQGHELGILVDAVAPTAEQSAALCAAARTTIKNGPYPGKLCDEGCVTFPYSPSDIDVGPVYRYNVWHLARDPDLARMFPIEYAEIGG
jgi:hypothetical protein